jgi:hypothetical protein
MQLKDLRERLAQESARLMIEHGIADYGLAKRKAAERFAVQSSGALPSNAQIELCLVERQRLFEPVAHSERVRRLRHLALRLMRKLQDFEPRLAGPVLAGTATINSVIEVHLFSASIELVSEMLVATGLEPAHCERRFRFGGGRLVVVPGFRVVVEDEETVMPVFPEHGLREAPLSSVDQRPMQRASVRTLAALLGEEA